MMIKIDHLSKKFDNKYVLKEISCAFTNGRVYGIMGENGAGKSTLFRCVMGLESYHGNISIENFLKVGYLNDTPFFYSFVTGMEYLEFCLKAKKLPINKQRISEVNEKFSLPLEKYASNYSLGMKKKLMIMALLLQDNDIIIMDEPFNGLDLVGSILLKQWIIKMKKEKKCIIVSSHIIPALIDICDDIFYIHRGEIVANYSGYSSEEIERELAKLYLTA